MRHRSRGQSTVEFALLAGTLFLMIMGIFDLGRAVAAYISIAEAAHEGARQLVLRSNETSAPPDSVIVNATLAKIGGGGVVLIEDPCLPGCSTPAQASTNPPANSGYIWITPNRTPGNHEVTVQITYSFSPMTAMISQLTGTTITMAASSSMRAEY
jgi:Flp pilus assembly protein TadG